MYDYYIGVDPGLHGALALIGPEAVRTFKTPIIKVGIKHHHEVREMARLVAECIYTNRIFAVLESVHSMPKQGVASSFSFGRGFGMWEGILAAYGIPYALVSPQTWKAVMLRDMAKDKGAAKLQAHRLWPNLDKLTDGEAEALLLAEFGRRQYNHS